jgi:hypothetical protein
MRRLGFAIVATVLGCAFAGCGDTGVQEGQIEYKSGNVDGLNAVRDAMAKNVKAADYKKKPTEAKPADQPAKKE